MSCIKLNNYYIKDIDKIIDERAYVALLNYKVDIND